jgi:hypothetical protein
LRLSSTDKSPTAPREPTMGGNAAAMQGIDRLFAAGWSLDL